MTGYLQQLIDGAGIAEMGPSPEIWPVLQSNSPIFQEDQLLGVGDGEDMGSFDTGFFTPLAEPEQLVTQADTSGNDKGLDLGGSKATPQVRPTIESDEVRSALTRPEVAPRRHTSREGSSLIPDETERCGYHDPMSAVQRSPTSPLESFTDAKSPRTLAEARQDAPKRSQPHQNDDTRQRPTPKSVPDPIEPDVPSGSPATPGVSAVRTDPFRLAGIEPEAAVHTSEQPAGVGTEASPEPLQPFKPMPSEITPTPRLDAQDAAGATTMQESPASLSKPTISIGRVTVEILPERQPDTPPSRPRTAEAASQIGRLGDLRAARRLFALRRL